MAARLSALQILQLATILSLAFLSGISACLSLWIIPIILHASPPTMVLQFTAMIAKGERYLQPSSRILALLLGTLTWLVSRHPDSAVAATWKYCAASVALLVPVAPYEILAIFPFNDRITEIGANMAKKRGEMLDKNDEMELRALLGQWQVRNIVRALMPLLAALVLLWNVVCSQNL